MQSAVELIDGSRIKPHIHCEQPEAQHPIGRAVIANEASATVTGAGGFPIGAFSGPDRPQPAKPHRAQGAVMNDNLSWLPLVTGPGETRGGAGGWCGFRGVTIAAPTGKFASLFHLAEGNICTYRRLTAFVLSKISLYLSERASGNVVTRWVRAE